MQLQLSSSILGKRYLLCCILRGRGRISGAMMNETQPQEVWRSSWDSIGEHTDHKEERPSSRSSSGFNQNREAGSVYLQEEEGYREWLHEMVGRSHSYSHDDRGSQFIRCSSVVVQRVEAPLSVAWSLVRRFDKPQIYKQFVCGCFLAGEGDLKVNVGSVREVQVVSGLPAATSTERLDILDDEQHILSFSILGGDHRLSNYRSITSLHERLINGKPGTIVIESYVVDAPHGNTKEETCLFVDTIVKCNLQSLADVSKHQMSTGRCL